MTGIYQSSALSFVYPDAGLVNAVSIETERRGSRRVFVIASSTLAANPRGPVAELVQSLGSSCVGVARDLGQHTPLSAVVATAAQVRASEADLLVAIGGGSVIDGAKATKAALAAGIDDTRKFAAYSLANPDRNEIPSIALPLIAAPTTLSAAEFTATAGYTDPTSGLKEGVAAGHLLPDAIALCPDLALATPIDLWLTSGCRSIDHAVEGLFSRQAWPALKWQAVAGLRELAIAMRAAYADPNDRDARKNAQHAVWLISDCCRLLPMGASHGLGYLLGTLGNVAHGATSAVLLPAVAEWNAQVDADTDQLIADAVGGESASDALSRLFADIGMPSTIRSLGVEHELLEGIARRAKHHPTVRSNPRPLADEAQTLELLERAW